MVIGANRQHNAQANTAFCFILTIKFRNAQLSNYGAASPLNLWNRKHLIITII